MPAPTAATVPRPKTSGPGIRNINPVTGLSTDYLNPFPEALMALEMVGDMPECIDDLRCSVSRLDSRGPVISMYVDAPRPLREALDRLADTLNASIAEARDASVRQIVGGPRTTALWTRRLRHSARRLAAPIGGVAAAPPIRSVHKPP